MKGIPFSEQLKELIIKKVREGESIDSLSKEFKVNSNTIRKWLALNGGVSGVSSTGRNLKSNDLMIARLNREKQELIAIIGELTVQLKKKL
jgi:transposase-like protein